MTLPPAPPPLTLDYQRLDRARKVAIGGLRLLSILISVIAALFLLLIATELYRSRGATISPTTFAALAALAVIFTLGLVKFACSLFIARRSRIAALIAFYVICFESLILFIGLIRITFNLLDNTYEPAASRVFIFLLLSLVLLGWLAVGYEIFQVLRLEQRQILPPADRP